jgi:hypothetical protein
MDAITDLSARTTAFIIIIQQHFVLHHQSLSGEEEISIFRSEGKQKPSFSAMPKLSPKVKDLPGISNSANYESFRKKVISLIWINNHDADESQVMQCFINRASAVVNWIWQKDIALALTEIGLTENPLPPPDQWRNAISKILYHRPDERLALSRAISYIPIQIVLAAGGCVLGTLEQRILQEWRLIEDDPESRTGTVADYTPKEYMGGNINILQQNITDLECLVLKKHHRKCWGQSGFSSTDAIAMLKNQDFLVDQLKLKKVPLSFEFILSEEINEIFNCRFSRYEEDHVSKGNNTGTLFNPATDFRKIEDPIMKAEQMEFYALAFSGGGIRTATFNLGVLQAFAEADHLRKFDYISTVSGGGYLGSWLVSWIKREGSVLKVGNRLNPKQSSDPMADEVRPIRWLRMYSNYLSPNSSVMSTDAWTMGMTLLRNMFLNQTIIAFLLFTVILFGKLGFLLWTDQQVWPNDNSFSAILFFSVSSFLIISGALLAGRGMRNYHKRSSGSPLPYLPPKTKITISDGLLFLSCVFALYTSSYFYNHDVKPLFLFGNDSTTNSFVYLLCTALPFGSASLAGLLLVAIRGKYGENAPFKGVRRSTQILLIVIFSIIAAFLGMVVLGLFWEILRYLNITKIYITVHGEKEPINHLLAFTFGFPLLLEVLSFTVVMRMAFLGKFFPDERREWWGRMGGITHQISFVWVFVFGAALFGGMLIGKIADMGISAVVAAGGWGALVLGSVKAAFSAKSSDEGKPSPLRSALALLSRLGPYLFALGLLIFLPVVLGKLLLLLGISSDIGWITLAMVVTGLLTWFLGNRIGVNEFSMHHFYKNRLVRAYLGATRDRSERKKTASNFTGFDSQDDLVLSELTNKDGYYGPYPILNTALNASVVSELDRQDRMAESFIFTPLYCGFDFSRTRSSVNVQQKSYDYAYRPTAEYAYPDKGAHLGSAMAISGAAANPNMGYHTSPATAFLLTAFNVRLGWWIGNPRKSKWTKSDPPLGLPYLISDLVGKSDTDDDFVCLSDGGHFDNMGLYELIRRRTKVIVLGDGEQDEKFICEGLANAIRRCRIDFGVEIDIKVNQITNLRNGFSAQSYAIGDIYYPGKGQFVGKLIYLKASLCRTQPVDVREYALKNKTFPHQSTGDQFFNEEQFESYRKLGYEIAKTVLRDSAVIDLFDVRVGNLEHLL